MLQSSRYVGCISTLWTILFLSQPTVGTRFVPRDVASGETMVRRACEPATPDVNASSIIANICNQTLVNEFNQCPDQMAVSIQKSTANTCEQYSHLFTDCMLANNNDSVACSDPHFGYQDCAVYTMQAYAYCGCYYTLPKSIADCANQQLQPQAHAQNITTLLATNTPLAAIPTSSENPAGAVTADKEPTPPYPIPSEDITSATNQGPPTTSDPQISTAPSNNPEPDKQLQPQPQTQNTTMLLATNTSPTIKPTSSELPAGAVTANKEPTPSYLIPSEDSIPATNQDFPTTSDPQISAASQNNPDSDTTWSVLNVGPSTGAELSTTTVISTYTTTIYTTTITTAATTTTIITTSASIGTTTVYTCISSDVTIPAVESTTPPAKPAARNGNAVCVGCRRGRRSKII